MTERPVQMNHSICRIGLILIFLVTDISVSAEDVLTLSGTNQIEDAMLRSDGSTANYGGVNYVIIGKLGTGVTNNTLLRFAGLSAASGQTVTNATLRLYKTDWSNQTADVTVNIYQVAAANAGWVEGAGLGTTVGGTSDWRWKIQTANTPWAGGQDSGCGKAGMDYTTSLVGSVTALDATAGYLAINLDVSVVQNWIDNPSQNYGLILTASGASAGQVIWFNSSEAVTNGPELILNLKETKFVISGSMNSFSYLRTYADPINLADRPLDWNPQLGTTTADSLKLQRMEDSGIDVCAKAVFYADGNPPIGGDTTTGLGIFKRTLTAAQNRRIRVAPEICLIRQAKTYGVDDLADFFEEMITDYGDDPRWFRYKGKLVVFLWNPFDDNYGTPTSYGPSDLQDVWDLLGSELRSKLYVINETSYMTWQTDTYTGQHWNDNNYVSNLLSVSDNLFWWYTWPTGERQQFRTELLMNTMYSLASEPVITATQAGYYRKNTGILNPYGVTARFRDLWNVGLNASPDWVYFVCWDDYSENTQFEPSRNNRGFYSSLARTEASEWKSLSPVPPAETWIGMPLCVMRGYELQAEVAQLNVTSPYSQVVLALEDTNGQELWRSSATAATNFYDSVKIFPFSVPTTAAVFDGQDVLVPVLYPSGTNAVRGLSPIRLTRNHPTNPMYQFYRMDQLRQPSSLQFSYTSVPANGQTNAVQGSFQITAGSTNLLKRVEIRDMNNYAVPYEGGNFPAISNTNEVYYLPFDPPYSNSLSGTFGFTPAKLHDASAMTYLFVEYTDGAIWSSPPQGVGFTNGTAQTTVFELGPMTADPSLWIPSSCENLSTSEVCVADWHMSDYNSAATYNGYKYVPDRGLYGFPLYLGYGPNTRTYTGTTNNYPIPGVNYLSFNITGTGNSGQVMRLPDFALPPGALSVEIEFWPLNITEEQYLLWHSRGGLVVKLQNGHITVSRGENVNGSTNLISLTSAQTIPAHYWRTIRVGDDGSLLYIYIDGQLDSISAHTPLEVVEPMSTWNNLILVGGSTCVTNSFHGHIRTLNIKNGGPLPGGFLFSIIAL